MCINKESKSVTWWQVYVAKLSVNKLCTYEKQIIAMRKVKKKENWKAK